MAIVITALVTFLGMPVVSWLLNRGSSKLSGICVRGPKEVRTLTRHYAAPGLGARAVKLAGEVY